MYGSTPATRALPDKLRNLLTAPRVAANVINLERAQAVRELWQEATQGLEQDSTVVHLFERCVGTCALGSVARNELMVALGRPVERRLSTHALRSINGTPPNGAAALDNAVRCLTRIATSSTDTHVLRAALSELQSLCNVDAPETLAAQRALICAMLDSPLGSNTGMVSEVQNYLRYARVDLKTDADKHLRIINAADRIVSPALGADVATLQWCRNFVLSCIEVQTQALANPDFVAQHAEIGAARSRLEATLAGLNQRLGVLTEPAYQPESAPELAVAVRSLPVNDGLRKLIESKFAQQRTGTPAERSDATEFLRHLARHPRLRTLLDPESVRLPTLTDQDERNKAVAAARESWHAKIVGQDTLCESIMHRLGTLLETGGKGHNILLVGPPGVGKTEVAKIIATAFGRELVEIQGEAQERRGQLSGNEGMYRNTGPGAIARAMLRCDRPPVILINEFGKASEEAQTSLATVLDRANN